MSCKTQESGGAAAEGVRAWRVEAAEAAEELEAEGREEEMEEDLAGVLEEGGGRGARPSVVGGPRSNLAAGADGGGAALEADRERVILRTRATLTLLPAGGLLSCPGSTLSALPHRAALVFAVRTTPPPQTSTLMRSTAKWSVIGTRSWPVAPSLSSSGAASSQQTTCAVSPKRCHLLVLQAARCQLAAVRIGRCGDTVCQQPLPVACCRGQGREPVHVDGGGEKGLPRHCLCPR